MASVISASTTSATALNMSADTTGVLQLATGATPTTAVTIDTSQNVGIGTTSPTNFGSNFKMFAVQGTDYGVIQGISNSSSTTIEMMAAGSIGYLGTRTNHPLALRTNDTERMRIDSSGNVLVGTTSSIGGKISSVNAGDAIAGQVLSNNNFSTFLGKNLSGTATFVVSGTGQISAAFTTINSTSDQRLKENITNLDVGLDAVMALKPRKFDWKEGKGKNIKGDRGFIAQEFETVFPDLVGISKYDIPKDEEPYKTISVDLMPVLVKAIQEQQTIINDLKARVTALEAK